LRDLVRRGCDTKTPVAAVVEVTPETAEYLLEHMNKVNRRPSQRVASTYAKSMERCLWEVTSQGLGVDWTAHMTDGQHRCLSATISRVPFQTAVVTGLRPESYIHTDNGAKRTAQALTNLTPPNIGIAQFLSGLVAFKRQPLPEELALVNDVIKDALAEIYTEMFAGTKPRRNKFNQRHILAAGTLRYAADEASRDYVKLAMADMAAGNDDHLSPLLTQIADRIRRDKFTGPNEEFGLIWYALGEGADAPATRRFPSVTLNAKQAGQELLGDIFA
jgi:hypothetical protein